MTARPKVIVIHVGAPFNYAIPAVLERGGMLEAFYTDMCAGRGVGRLAPYTAHLPLIGSRFMRLAKRAPPPGVFAKTVTFDTTSIVAAAIQNFSRTGEARARARLDAGERFGQALLRRGFGEATHVYSVFGQGQSFLREAKRQGLKVISDVNVALSAEQIVVEEQKRFPDWEAPRLYWGETIASRDPTFRPTEIMREDSDLLLCPSQFVRDDLIANFNVPSSRTRIVPYPAPNSWLTLDTRPERGRILLVGGADLRKGAHYFAMAAAMLNKRGRNYDFKLAGDYTEMFQRQSASQHVDLLGRVPRSEIHKEFSFADVFVLPSLAEGSAGVIYEALAAGVPVITTFEAGSVVRDGIDGLIIPSRDVAALADAIETIVEDREVRNRMATSAREWAREFTWECYGDRLIESIRAA